MSYNYIKLLCLYSLTLLFPAFKENKGCSILAISSWNIRLLKISAIKKSIYRRFFLFLGITSHLWWMLLYGKDNSNEKGLFGRLKKLFS